NAARTPIPAQSAQKVAWTKAAVAAKRPEPELAVSAPRIDGSVQVVDSVPALVRQLLVRPPDVGGFRTLVTGETDGVNAAEEAIELAKALTEAGSDVMLVDWSPDGQGAAEVVGVHAKSGIADLLEGRAKFEDVVERIPGSSAQFIPAGT